LTIRESINLSYDGIELSSMGLISVNLQSGMQEEHFLPRKTIKEVKIKGNDAPYFQGISYEPLQFQLTFAFIDSFDTDKIRSVARWLNTPTYRPLQFSSDRIYYVMVVDDSNLIHNCLSQGYITLTFRCNSPWSFTPVYDDPVLDFSDNAALGTHHIFKNIGDLTIRPQIQVEIISGTGFKIVNTSNGGQYIEFANLVIGEIITIDGERKSVDSSLPFTYRYDNMTDGSKFLEMLFGYNYLIIYGSVKIKMKYQCAFIG